MLIRRNARNVSTRASIQFWLLVAAGCITLAGTVLTFPIGTVQADALLARPAATQAPKAPFDEGAPQSLRPQEAKSNRHDALHGIASWYGSVFNGRKTANGERFNMFALTACHPTLPFGTTVRVVNLNNKRSVMVRITDRGDLLGGRIIDLSYAAAEKLQMTKAGVAPVALEVVAENRQPPTN